MSILHQLCYNIYLAHILSFWLLVSLFAGFTNFGYLISKIWLYRLIVSVRRFSMGVKKSFLHFYGIWIWRIRTEKDCFGVKVVYLWWIKVHSFFLFYFIFLITSRIEDVHIGVFLNNMIRLLRLCMFDNQYNIGGFTRTVAVLISFLD